MGVYGPLNADMTASDQTLIYLGYVEFSRKEDDLKETAQNGLKYIERLRLGRPCEVWTLSRMVKHQAKRGLTQESGRMGCHLKTWFQRR